METKSIEIMKDKIISKLQDNDKNLNEMISYADEWKDSKEIRNILLGQINDIRFERKILNIQLKVTNFIMFIQNKITNNVEKVK